MSWGNRKPQKQLTLITIDDDYLSNDLFVGEEYNEVIEKYKKLGVIGKFGTENFDAEGYEYGLYPESII